MDVETPLDHPLMQGFGGQDMSFRFLQRHKLRHDAEQIEHLVKLRKLPKTPWKAVAREYRALIELLPSARAGFLDEPMQELGGYVLPVLPPDKMEALVPRLHGESSQLVRRSFNRAIHLERPSRLPSNETVLSSTFDSSSITRNFFASGLKQDIKGCDQQNGLAVVDDVLSGTTLRQLKKWCDEST
eukprot:3833337-Prymnesium_polylepis.1